eukprot:ANDGO_01642.mRNA.1 hypothetical protein
MRMYGSNSDGAQQPSKEGLLIMDSEPTDFESALAALPSTSAIQAELAAPHGSSGEYDGISGINGDIGGGVGGDEFSDILAEQVVVPSPMSMSMSMSMSPDFVLVEEPSQMVLDEAASRKRRRSAIQKQQQLAELELASSKSSSLGTHHQSDPPLPYHLRPSTTRSVRKASSDSEAGIKSNHHAQGGTHATRGEKEFKESTKERKMSSTNGHRWGNSSSATGPAPASASVSSSSSSSETAESKSRIKGSASTRQSMSSQLQTQRTASNSSASNASRRERHRMHRRAIGLHGLQRRTHGSDMRSRFSEKRIGQRLAPWSAPETLHHATNAGTVLSKDRSREHRFHKRKCTS